MDKKSDKIFIATCAVSSSSSSSTSESISTISSWIFHSFFRVWATETVFSICFFGFLRTFRIVFTLFFFPYSFSIIFFLLLHSQVSAVPLRRLLLLHLRLFESSFLVVCFIIFIHNSSKHNFDVVVDLFQRQRKLFGQSQYYFLRRCQLYST